MNNIPATITFTLIDDGEPGGGADRASYLIMVAALMSWAVRYYPLIKEEITKLIH